MATLPFPLWLAIGAVIAIAALGALFLIAARLRDERALRDLMAEARRIREEHERRIAAMRAQIEEGELGEVDIIYNEEPAAAA